MRTIDLGEIRRADENVAVAVETVREVHSYATSDELLGAARDLEAAILVRLKLTQATGR